MESLWLHYIYPGVSYSLRYMLTGNAVINDITTAHVGNVEVPNTLDLVDG